MKFSTEEKKIIRLLVRHESKGLSIANLFNLSGFLEKRGIGFVNHDRILVFVRKDKYPDYERNEGLTYIQILFGLFDKLYDVKYILRGNNNQLNPLVIGAYKSEWEGPNMIVTDCRDNIRLDGPFKGWYGANGQEKYWMYDEYYRYQSTIDKFYSTYIISEELKDLVKHNFKTEEQIRFVKQQIMTWVSIGLSTLLGILGLIF